ncbi:XylR family transcriptional regulator [Rubinisphaera sp. JC750]|uniref:XylR family transcriptional regulator n=1 Tax=Rubinisphaera sp. JC750 TaxID=2898658 RepID=UPI001F47058B|nr:DNA-binding transcriptional regulator [Rubinisphaera sp. JC750]
MSQSLRVALLVETSRSYGREVLRGLWRYVQEHETWSLLYRPHGFGHTPPSWITNWDGDGIIAQVDCEKTAQLLTRSGVPTVDVLGDVVTTDFPMVICSSEDTAEMAVAYFRNRGFESFATCGLRRGLRPRLDARCDAFVAEVERAGFTCERFSPRGGGPEGPSWEREQLQIGRWIASLPKPLALLACNDTRGREALYACQSQGISVPEEVAILGVGNDELICELSEERLSSIDVNPQQIGYLAADMLARLMRGEAVPSVTTNPPARVVSRRSSDALAVQDLEVTRAIQFIRTHACRQIQVDDVVGEVNLERRVLERRFRKLLGRSPKAEIIRVQLSRAAELLLETTLTNTEIAYRCGFNNPSYFMDLFHRKMGQTPGEYRGLSLQRRETDSLP